LQNRNFVTKGCLRTYTIDENGFEDYRTIKLITPEMKSGYRQMKKHCLSCQAGKPLKVLEVTFGNWQQDDIKRFEEDYKR